MNVFISEHVTGGSWGDRPLNGSLAREGAAMIRALVEDCVAIDGCRVTTTWDQRLGEFPVAGGSVDLVGDPGEAAAKFSRRAAEADATLVIAPELDGALAEQWQAVADAGGRWLGSDLAAIQLAGDKLAVAHRLEQLDVPTIPTRVLEPLDRTGWNWPRVIKRRDGAGAVGTRLVHGAGERRAFVDGLDDPGDWVEQPLVAGESLSVAVLVDTGGCRETLPVGRQLINLEDNLAYRGGLLPVDVEWLSSEMVDQVVGPTLDAIPGLAGWVGIDLLAPDDGPGTLLVVEINPRLTTSYLGYRAIALDNLAERLVKRESGRSAVRFGDGHVRFDSSGSVEWDTTRGSGDAGTTMIYGSLCPPAFPHPGDEPPPGRRATTPTARQ